MFEEKVDELIMSKEHQVLIKFRDFPNLNENKNITSDGCYNPTLYKYDGYWFVDWISDEGDSIASFMHKNICDVIEKASEWLSNKFKNPDSK